MSIPEPGGQKEPPSAQRSPTPGSTCLETWWPQGALGSLESELTPLVGLLSLLNLKVAQRQAQVHWPKTLYHVASLRVRSGRIADSAQYPS